MTNKKIITRFAPSPTGFLHIGGARTALFNWLFARHHQGQFLLRIEDTDLARSTPEATQAILYGLNWLGLNPDQPPLYQSQRQNEHKAAALHLLKQGTAYRCYCTEDELNHSRQQARERGYAFRSPYRDQDSFYERPYTIRFRVPEGQTRINDHIQGLISWQNDQFDDLVLLRADGTPTYMLAVVVDDHDMEISHIVRGDDHLINAARQSLIYRALAWSQPEYAHIPLIHGPDGKKLSKRHGALGIESYQQMGYLPQGLRNYLLKLGWSHGDKEIFTDHEAIKLFNLTGIGRAPARLDYDKMAFINAQHMQRMRDEELYTYVLPFLEKAYGATRVTALKKRFLSALESLKKTSKTLKDLSNNSEYLLQKRPIPITPKAAKHLTVQHQVHICNIYEVLKNSTLPWTKTNIHMILENYASHKQIAYGKLAQSIRAALTGGLASPDLSLVISLLGKEETLLRLRDAINLMESLNEK